MLLVVVAASGQARRGPATLDDVLLEIQGMRAEINRAASTSMRAQVVTASLLLHEARLGTAVQQLSDVRRQLAESRLRLAPSTEQIKPAQDTNSQILAPLRYTLQEEDRRTRELRAEEAELTRVIESEELRWTEFRSRLDELEQALAQAR
jgi:hypothetical protein